MTVIARSWERTSSTWSFASSFSNSLRLILPGALLASAASCFSCSSFASGTLFGHYQKQSGNIPMILQAELVVQNSAARVCRCLALEVTAAAICRPKLRHGCDSRCSYRTRLRKFKQGASCHLHLAMSFPTTHQDDAKPMSRKPSPISLSWKAHRLVPDFRSP